MAPKARAVLRLCSFAAAAWPAAGLAGGADELAMVQSMLELSHHHQFEQDSQQYPRGIFPAPGMPAPNISMNGIMTTVGDMSPMVENLQIIDGTMAAFRDDEIFGEILVFLGNVSKGIMVNAKGLKTDLDEINGGQLPTESSEAFSRAARVMLAFEKRMKRGVTLIQDIAAPLNAKMNKAKAEEFLDTADHLKGLVRDCFNSSRTSFEEHENKTSKLRDHEACKEFNSHLICIAKFQRYEQDKARVLGQILWNNTNASVGGSPLMLQIPDLRFKLQQWAKVAGQATRDLADSYHDMHAVVLDAVIRILNNGAKCRLDEEKITRRSAASTRSGVLLAAAAALAASAWGIW